MGTVIMHSVVSVDGFIADDKGEVGSLHEWYFSGDTPITEGATSAASKASTCSRIPTWSSRATGCCTCGSRYGARPDRVPRRARALICFRPVFSVRR